MERISSLLMESIDSILYDGGAGFHIVGEPLDIPPKYQFPNPKYGEQIKG